MFYFACNESKIYEVWTFHFLKCYKKKITFSQYSHFLDVPVLVSFPFNLTVWKRNTEIAETLSNFLPL